jgi:hypothetical protein
MQSQDEKVTHEYRLAYENLVEQTVDPVQSEALIRQLATDRWRVS